MAGNELVEVERIRDRAYQLWEQDGCPEGRDLDYWYKAEAELHGEGASCLESPSGGSTADRPAGASEGGIASPGEPSPEQVAQGRGNRRSGAMQGTAAETEGRTGAAAEYGLQKRTRKKAEG